MKKKEYLYTIIEDYLNGKLNGPELIQIERRIMVDPDFATEVDSYNYLLKVIDLAGKPNFRENLQVYEHAEGYIDLLEEHESTPFSFSEPIKIFMRSIIVSLVILIPTVVFLLNKPDLNARVFSSFFQTHDIALVTNFNTISEETSWKSATSAYNNRNYDKAYETFSTAFTNSNYSYLGEFYAGISLLSNETGSPEKAIKHFKESVKQNSSFHEAANWYTALAYLKLGKTDRAKDVFNSISSHNSYKKIEAEQILSQL